MVKKFFALMVLFSVLIFSGVSYADIAYLKMDFDTATSTTTQYLCTATQNGTVTSQISLGSMSQASSTEVFTFNRDNNNFILICRNEYSDINNYFNSSNVRLSLYNAANINTPLATRTINNAFAVISVAEYGNNILVGTTGSRGTLYEINPSTLEIISSYDYFNTSDFASNSIFESVAANYNGTIYAAFGHMLYEAGDYTGEVDEIDRLDFVTMDGLGNVTSRHERYEHANNLTGTAFSGGNFYISLGRDIESEEDFYGIYRTNGIEPANATKVVDGNVSNICTDGSGGLYYTVYESDTDLLGNALTVTRKLYHWNGSTSTLVYDFKNYDESGENIAQYYASINDILDIDYDINNNVLFVGLNGRVVTVAGESINNIAGINLSPDNANNEAVYSFSVIGSSGNSYGNSSNVTPVTPVPSPDNPSAGDPDSTALPEEIVEPVGYLSPDVLENIAEALLSDDIVDIDVSELKFITSDNIKPAQEPTDTMNQIMRDEGYQAAYKLNTLTVSDDGYYVFVVNVPAEFVGKSLRDMRVYAFENSTGSNNVNNSFMGLVNGALNYLEITNLFGVKIDRLEAQVLAVGFLHATQPLCLYIARIIFALLTGGLGCNLTGTGAAALFAVCLIFIMCRKNIFTKK